MSNPIKKIGSPVKRAMQSSWSSVRFSIIQSVFKRKSFDPNDAILIFSDPRGGSTWLMELVGQIDGTATIFEPLHLQRGLLDSALEFGWRQYIPADFQWAAAKSNFAEIFEGRRINPWTCSKSPLSRFIHAKRLICKFVRGNSLLPWLTRQFDFHSSPIHLLRHPIPCCLSQLRSFQVWGNRADSGDNSWPANVSEKRHPFPTLYEQHGEFLGGLKTNLERTVAIWCIHNLPVLNAEENQSWCTVFYEDLLISPEQELVRIFRNLDVDVPAPVFQRIRRPSQTVSKNDFEQNPISQLEKWTHRLDNDEKKRIQEVLDYFDIKIYSAHEPMPLKPHETAKN